MTLNEVKIVTFYTMLVKHKDHIIGIKCYDTVNIKIVLGNKQLRCHVKPFLPKIAKPAHTV